jgi:hypothetical protein
VNKVAGNFHFAAGHSYQQGSLHIHDMAPFADKALDFSHKITKLAFGTPYPVRRVCAVCACLPGTAVAAACGVLATPAAHMPDPALPGAAAPCSPHPSPCSQGMRNPLDGVSQVKAGRQAAAAAGGAKAPTGMYQYFLKV